MGAFPDHSKTLVLLGDRFDECGGFRPWEHPCPSGFGFVESMPRSLRAPSCAFPRFRHVVRSADQATACLGGTRGDRYYPILLL